MEQDVTQIMMTLTKQTLSSMSIYVSRIKLHLSLSYAFSKSILIAMIPFFPFFDYMQWSTSCMITILSLI